MHLFDDVSSECSKIATKRYSTSFSSAISLLNKDLRTPIYHIYGFVRFADEIVDTFHEFNKPLLLEEFKKQTYEAIERKISLNPILHSFQMVVNKYNIDHDLIHAFFRSMEIDLTKQQYDEEGYKEYIYGSAEVVGLMCLFVFCDGNKEMYLKLKPYAQSLGSAFQKVNFLRDLKADSQTLQRVYFPDVDFNHFTSIDKKKIEEDIENDFQHSFEGILLLPKKSRPGVYLAYRYYLCLLKKIKKSTPSQLVSDRIRVPDSSKFFIVMGVWFRVRFNFF